MEAVGTNDAFKKMAVNKAIEAAAMGKAYTMCDSTRTSTEQQRIAANAGWEQEKSTSAKYRDKAKRNGRWILPLLILSIVSTSLHFVQ